ncbi:MAG: VWA domain-containing protein [Parvibaculaceae bacterium]
MIPLDQLAILRPWWLLALPVLALVAYAAHRRTQGLPGWESAVEPRLLAALGKLGRIVPGSGRRDWPAPVAASLLAIALAGPALRSTDAVTYRNLDGLVVVMDLSRSVALSNHFDAARIAARSVVDSAGSRPTALVVYAGDAYVASAFSTDPAVLGTTIAVLDGETVPDPGTRPALGLALARRMLSEASIVSGDVVLISDGGALDDTALQEARAIRSAGSFLSTLVLPEGAGPEKERGDLQRLADAGGGASASVVEPDNVLQSAAARPAARLERQGLAGLFWNDLGSFILILALIPALALFRQRG